MYVAYEPTWEWRFIKEVFHRDKLVGMEGFRTFLSSSDPRVRESNVLFLPTLTPKRSEFFANDVIFLDDMPRTALTDRFCEMTKEYVSNLGGGLVVIAGPRVRPARTAPDATRRHAAGHRRSAGRAAHRAGSPEFRPRLTPHAARYPLHAAGRRADAESSPKPGTISASCPGISRWRRCTSRRSPWPSIRPTSASRRQDAAAADRHAPVRQRRSGLPRLQRNVAAAAEIRREVLSPVLVAAHLSPRHEPRAGRTRSGSSSASISSSIAPRTR